MQSELEHRQMVQELISALIDVLTERADYWGDDDLQVKADNGYDAVLYRASEWLKSSQRHAPSSHQEVTPLTPGADPY
jgi:hypothetical protein